MGAGVNTRSMIDPGVVVPSVHEPAPSHGSRAMNLAAFDQRHCAKSEICIAPTEDDYGDQTNALFMPAPLYGVAPCGHRTLVSPSSLFPAQVSAVACVNNTDYRRIRNRIEFPRHCSRRARRASNSNRRTIDKTGAPFGRRRRIFEATICGHP